MSAIGQAWERLRSVRHIEWVLLCMACAAVLIVMGGAQEAGGSATQLERRMESVLSCVEGAGKVRVLVNETPQGTVHGVLVVAQGADDLRVAMALERAVRALLNIESEQIEILGMAQSTAPKE
jgi:hypothetical protein